MSSMVEVSSWNLKKVILANVAVKTPAWKEDASNIIIYTLTKALYFLLSLSLCSFLRIDVVTYNNEK